MDGASVVGLASAVISILEVGLRLVRTAQRVHQATGSLSGDGELETFTCKMTKWITEFRSNPEHLRDDVLDHLCRRMERVAQELLRKLEERTRPNRSALGKAVVIGFHELIHPKQLEELEKELCDLLKMANSRVVNLRYVFVFVFTFTPHGPYRSSGMLTGLKGLSKLLRYVVKLIQMSRP